MSIKSDEKSGVVGDNPLAVVGDVLLSIGVFVDNRAVLWSLQKRVVVVTDDGELRVRLREPLAAHRPMPLLSLVAVGLTHALTPRMNHVPKHSSVKGAKEDLPLLGIVGCRLSRNMSPHELVDSLGSLRLVAFCHEEQ